MAALLFISLFVLMFLSVPIALALAASSALVSLIYYPQLNLVALLAQAMVTTADSFPLMAIPFFMLVGTLMDKSGLSTEVVDAAEALVGDIPGGLGASTVVACMIFAAISGSGPAVVAALGTILVPAMVKRGYSAAYAGALVAAGATIGPVIPPSIPMIVYSVVVGVSTVAMFTGGFLPGIVMGLFLILTNYLIAKKRGYVGKPREGGFLGALKQCWGARWALLLPFIILGGIYGGLFTPTEAAVVGSSYALVIGVLKKTLTLGKIKDAMVEAALLSCLAMFVLGGATTFGRLLMLERIPQMLAQQMLGLTKSPLIIMGLIMIFLLITGCFIDTISNVVLFAPLFAPVAKALNYDLVFFGVLMTVNLCIGMVTPPVGVNLYVAQGVCKAPFDQVIRESVPLLFALIGSLIVMLLFPELVLFLPRILGFLH